MKNLIFDICGVLFNYNQFGTYGLMNKNFSLFEKIDKGHEMLYSFANQTDSKGNRLYSLFVLSNLNKDNFNILYKSHTDIFSLFDGIIISGDTGFKKPDIRIYLHLLNKYNLQPEDCILIDDQYQNIKMAEEIGMKGFLFNEYDFEFSKVEKLIRL